MRILIPILNFGRGGGNRVLSRLADAWVDSGHPTTFLAPAGGDPPYFPTRAEIAWCSPRGIAGEGGAAPGGTRNLLSLWGGLRALHRDFDIVFANHSLTTWPVALAGVPAGKRFYYVQAYEPDYYRESRESMKFALSALSYRLGFATIVNAATYPGLGDAPVVPFGIDLSTFPPRRPRASLDDGAPIVLGTIGRHEPGKGTRYVLDAFARLHAADPRYRLRIAYGNLPVGWSHPAAEVVPLADDPALAAFYRSLDILVVGAYGQDGAPHYPVLEAMASAVPVVTGNYLPATADIAWMVPPHAPEAIAEQVRAVVAAPDRLARIEAARAVAEVYGWPVIGARMIELFETMRCPR